MKDDADLSTLKIKPGHAFMLLGTPGDDAQPPAVVPPPKFIEDMSEAQIAQETKYPTGLQNLGNTCYLNSTLQALRTIPEVRGALNTYSGPPTDVTGSLRRLYSGMDSGISVPSSFLSAFKARFPQFAEVDNRGYPKQQDAEEAWSTLINLLRGSLKSSSDVSTVEEYMSGAFETELKSVETPEDEVKKEVVPFYKLDCHISINTNYLKDGILDGLSETVEKHNPELGRDAEYQLTKRITRLPKYLTVHYVRFYWRRDTQKNSKILRKVVFPKELDVTDLCTDELKTHTVPVREKLMEIRKEEEDTRRAAKKLKLNAGAAVASAAAEIKDAVTPEKKAEYKEALDRVVKEHLDPSAGPGSNPSGLYELQAVVTHQGASADSGHYQAFVRNDAEEGQWWRFNDNKVTIVDESKIDALAGGGESDSALILLYREASI